MVCFLQPKEGHIQVIVARPTVALRKAYCMGRDFTYPQQHKLQKSVNVKEINRTIQVAWQSFCALSYPILPEQTLQVAKGMHHAVHRSHSLLGVHPSRKCVTKGPVTQPGISKEELSQNDLVMHLNILDNRSSIEECIQVWFCWAPSLKGQFTYQTYGLNC